MLTFDTNGNIYIFSEEDGEKPKKKGFFKKHWKKLLGGAALVGLGTAAYLNKDKLGEGFNKAKEFVGNKIQALKDRKGPAPEDKVAPEPLPKQNGTQVSEDDESVSVAEDLDRAKREAYHRGQESSADIQKILDKQQAEATKKAQTYHQGNPNKMTLKDYVAAMRDASNAQRLAHGLVSGAGYTATFDPQRGIYVDANGNEIKRLDPRNQAYWQRLIGLSD